MSHWSLALGGLGGSGLSILRFFSARLSLQFEGRNARFWLGENSLKMGYSAGYGGLT